jgi:hypothetical protein
VNHDIRVEDDGDPRDVAATVTPPTMSRRAPDLCEWLRTMDFSFVQVEYVGAHEGGQFLAPRCYRAVRADHWSVVGARSAQLIALFTALLESRYPDWRAADGSCGDFRWDLNTDELVHTHYVRGERNDRYTLLGI